MTKQEKTYKAVNAALKKSPNTPIGQIFKQLKVDGSSYYNERRKRERLTTKTKKKYEKIEVAPKQQLAVIMGSPDQLREFLGGVL